MNQKIQEIAKKVQANFMQYGYDAVKNHYFDFKGRSDRASFWFFQLYLFIALFVVSFVFTLIQLPSLTMIAVLAILMPALGMSVRRLHDLGKKWYWLLISIIPGILVTAFAMSAPSIARIFQFVQLAGNIYLLVLYCQKGEDKENAWGKPVK